MIGVPRLGTLCFCGGSVPSHRAAGQPFSERHRMPLRGKVPELPRTASTEHARGAVPLSAGSSANQRSTEPRVPRPATMILAPVRAAY
jgi:hypothetical protein